MNLTTGEWIPLLTTNGPATGGLRRCFDDDVIAVAGEDEFENSSTMRLLVAVQIAAGREGITPQQWCDRHADEFELFSPTAPFWQNPDMARFADSDDAKRPLTNASYRDGGAWSLAVNLRHDGAGIVYSHAAAARLLVMRQMYSVCGNLPFKKHFYGDSATKGQASLGFSRPMLWLDTGRLSDSLALTASLTADHPAGTFWTTWPDGVKPNGIGSPTGVLDGLTWLSRSILLTDVTPDSVGAVMICGGIRWPEASTAKSALHSPARDQELLPYTTYTRKTARGPYIVRGVHVGHTPWRQLAEWCVDESGPAAGWQQVAADRGGSWHLSGMSGDKSAVHGPVSGSFPAPADPEAMRVFLKAVDTEFSSVASLAGSLNKAVTEFDGFYAAIPSHTALDAVAEPLARDLATGEISLADALFGLNDAKRRLSGTALYAVGRVRPLAAGRVSARRIDAAAAAELKHAVSSGAAAGGVTTKSRAATTKNRTTTTTKKGRA